MFRHFLLIVAVPSTLCGNGSISSNSVHFNGNTRTHEIRDDDN